VLPHGGPSARDEGGFDWLVQFLVSRGYGVLQPQFRGSTGFGPEFRAKGRQQWGLAMQDDVTDATQWLVQQNLADPKKICIVGASYGGYAALEGAVKEPALYACAAAIAPVTDIPAFLRDARHYVFADTNIPAIAGDDTDTEAVSPDDHAGRIQIPILLIHGMDDFTVSVKQTQKMEEALKEAGKDEQTIYIPGANHFLRRESDRLTVLNALESFLAKSL
jgi:dipeptidyl aminopeptidase/acylaminoacyl peptidase